MALGGIAYNLGNLLRRLALPLAIQSWSLTSLQQRLFKTGGRFIRHEETKSVLEGALKGGQPVAALRVCASVAQNIARRHEQQNWRVRRVSEKVRNPADTPDAEELAVLRAWQDEEKAGRLKPTTERQKIVAEGGRRYVHYMKPIFIAGPVCLQCHGAPDKFAPGVTDALKELFPHDQATGYAVGDLRGAVSVKIPIESRQ